MGIAFTVSQKLTVKDLYISIRDIGGQLTDPYEIKYDLFDDSQGPSLLLPPQGRIPVRASLGVYYSDYQIPTDATVGDYHIEWHVQDTPTSVIRHTSERFGVVGLGVNTFLYDVPESLKPLVQQLRIDLRDCNPDRNYHFRPPSDEKVIRGYTEKFGYIFENYELISYLEEAGDYVSLYPPYQNINIANIPAHWKTTVVLAATWFALKALTINWIEEEFSYSIGGISLELEKASKYQSMMDTIGSRLDTFLENAKKTLKYTKGLQQPRWRPSTQGVLGPYSAQGITTPRNMSGRMAGRPD